MSQNINLLDPALRRRRPVVTLGLVAQCLGVLLVALAGYHYYLGEQVKGLAAELQGAERVLQAQRAYAAKLKTRTAAAQPDKALDAEIARYEAEVKGAREALAALQGGALGDAEGFAEYLRAFSRQAVNGLWLTGFTITGGGEIEIRGRALDAGLVPGYIHRLNREKVLAGRRFAELEMARPGAKRAGSGQDAGAAAARFLEFRLATSPQAAEGRP